LSCRDVRLVMKTAREEVLPVPWNAIGDPIADCCSGLFGDFELDRSAGFPLDHRGAVPNSAPDAYVADLEPHEVTAPQLAVEGQIEQSEVASTFFELKPDADCPDLLWFQRALLADEATLVFQGHDVKRLSQRRCRAWSFPPTDPALRNTDHPRPAAR
jgi:hypothetical protein